MRLFFLIYFLLLIPQYNFANDHKFEIKLIKSGNYYFIEAKFEKISVPVIFLFDTGTNGFGITNELKDSLNIEKGDTINFTMGGLRIETHLFGIWKQLDNSHFIKDLIKARVPKFIYGGILGNYPIISNYYTIIDFDSDKLTLSKHLNKSEAIKLEREIQVIANFEWVNHMIFVEGVINDSIKGYFHFDTGIPTYHFLTLNAAKMANCKLENEKLEENHMKTIQCNSFIIGELDFGETSFLGQNMDYNKHPFGNYDLNNIIGSLCNDNLDGSIIHLDFRNRNIAIEKD